MKKNRKWCPPKLLVLARSNPEEMVLETCKGDGAKQPHQTGSRYCLAGKTGCPGNRLS